MSLIDDFLAGGSLWLVGLGLFGFMLLAAQAGAISRKRLARPARAGEDAEGYLLSATLALLGLLIAFTFSGAASRFDARRDLIVTETNAIGTAWLRLDLLPAAQPASWPDWLSAVATLAGRRLVSPALITT